MNLKTSIGALLNKLGRNKEIGLSKHLDLLFEMHDDDWEHLVDLKQPVYAWFSKMSLKDARMDIAKVAEHKGRLFEAQAMPCSLSGRRLLGDFIRRFMRACRNGGFVGVIGLVFSRGGWHECLKDMSDGFSIPDQFNADASKWDKNFFFLRSLLDLYDSCSSLR
jgi:hypothetical protein